MKAILGGRIVMPDRVITGKALLFDGRIRGIAEAAVAEAECDELIDARGLYVSPGLVDIHIHGYLGEDASDGAEACVRAMARGVLANGVTSFLPTTMTVPFPEIDRALRVVRDLMPRSREPGFDGAEVLGAHAEGPFINPSKKGAQAETAILAPDADKLLPYADVLRAVTLAPEMPGGLACVRKLAPLFTVSVGHTGASYAQAMQAFEAGADHVTHTFNAMTPLNHRDPGVAGAALACDRAYCELIADTFHIHPALFALLARVKGDHLVLISDCTRAGGLSDGEYTLGGQPIFVKGIECRLADGTIAGSVLRLNNAVRNLYEHTDLPVYAAVRCASLHAARSIRMGDAKGSLEPGKDADIALFDDDFVAHKTFVRGTLKYERT